MRPLIFVILSFPLSASALAQEDEGNDGYVTPEKEVAPNRDAARVDESIGGATGFEMREGMYVHGALGAFTRFGGFSKEQKLCPEVACAPVVASDLQPAVALAFGVDLSSWLAAQAQLGVGYVAGAAAYGERTADVPVDYALSRLELAGVARIDLFERWALSLTLGAGPAAITPSPGREQPWLGASATAGAGIRLLSLLPNMTIGADVMWHGAFFPAVEPSDPNISAEPLVIHALSMAPVIKYVF